MMVKVTATEFDEDGRILVLSPETFYEQNVLKEIVKTGFYLSVIYTSRDDIREVSIPLHKKAA